MCTQPHLIKSFTFPNGKSITKYFPCEFVSENPQVHIWRKELKARLFLRQITKFYVGEVGCGQCIECRLQKSREWANRCMIETLHHDLNKCFFVTLTYNNDHLLTPSLRFDDVNRFVLDLREKQRYTFKSDRTFRYVLCGEYGDQFGRPHFHLLMFNYDSSLDDQKYFYTNKFGNVFYRNPVMEKLWRSRGFVTVSDLNWQTCAYVARYVVKKLTGKGSEFYEENDLFPPGLRMSNRPGIGLGYLTDFYDQLDFIEKFVDQVGFGEDGLPIYNDKITLSNSNGKFCKLPDYFVQKLDQAYQMGMPLKIDFSDFKRWRQSCADMRHSEMLQIIDMPEREYMESRDILLKKQGIGQHRKFLESFS